MLNHFSLKVKCILGAVGTWWQICHQVGQTDHSAAVRRTLPCVGARQVVDSAGAELGANLHPVNRARRCYPWAGQPRCQLAARSAKRPTGALVGSPPGVLPAITEVLTEGPPRTPST